MPKRLIELSSADICPDVRIVDISKPCRYVALSYCWGPRGARRQVRSLKANIDAHKTRIVFTSIPKTIQDAVTLSRELGAEYLWVDALCIVQDDVEDIRGEIASMGDIYSNAYFTLVAAGAEHCDQGFLHKPLTEFREEDYFRMPYRYGSYPPCTIEDDGMDEDNSEDGNGLEIFPVGEKVACIIVEDLWPRAYRY